MANGERTENHPNRQVGRLRGSGVTSNTPAEPASRLRGKGLVSKETKPTAKEPAKGKKQRPGGTVPGIANSWGSGFTNED